MKGIVLIALLISLGLSVTVTDDSKCSACTEFKSQSDCENTYHGLGCEWKDSACAKKTTTPAETFKAYCETIEDPATKCAKTFGCAYVDGKCTHFTGCTAYVKTTLAECQTISYKCLTNGTTCDNVLECTEYTAENCEASPALSSPFKCKLDNGACRALNCSEAETSLQTTKDCDTWKTKCITNGYGCVDSLSNCSQYTGNADSCLKMLGSDGKCSFDTTTTDKCKLRVCSELKLSTYDDASCKAYKGTCVSTGFSCADSLSSCTAYDGNSTTCLTYIGSTGFCAADANATKCRERKCEDLKSGVLTECQTYLTNCLTNGVTCVTTLQKCAQYTGKKSECLKITGSDGKCKGTSDTDSNAACVLKTCADDDSNNETTDTACGLVQLGCKTTGAGCIDRLASCTSYTDDGNCLKLVGSEGKCKAGTGGKCAAKVCTDNTTATTNPACDEFKTGCVTSGAGCIGQSSCKDTVKQLTCDATFESSVKCAWSPVCISSTSCGALNTKSLCLNYKVGNKPCFWENNGCRLALCSDYTSTDSTVCNTYKPGCISNGTKCANPENCPTEFTGTKATCEGYPSPAHCTNDDAALATAACKNKSCADTTITAASDPDCETYLSGCLFAGTNKCIVNTAPCSSYLGTVEVCNTFTGYVSSTAPREKCSSSNGINCTTRQCYHATGMTSNDDCNTFLDGCLYNGDGSCVSPSAGCSSYKYQTNANECRAFKGDSGTTLCYDGSGNYCKNKSCSDETSSDVDSDTECASFMPTCVYNGKTGTRCVPNTNNCDLFEGTSDQCNGLTRNEKQCTRTESCKTRVCAEKTDANSNGDCTTYHSTCRLTHGTNTCVGAQTACASYTLVAANTDQQTYCNVVTEDDGGLCSYDTATTANCVARACKFWVSSLASSVSCVNYLGKDTCVLANTDYCYAVGACTSYSIPTSVTTGQAAWCNGLKSSSGLKCTHVSGGTCTAISTCEGVPSPVDQPDCQIQSGQNNCVLLNGKCVTIQTACTGYSLTGVSDANKSALCYGLKSNNAGTIKYCAYQTTTTGNCVERTCEDIISPTSQASCASVSNCTYYDGKCYTKKTCTTYTFPNSANSNDLKRLFCQNMTSNTDATFCSFDVTLNSGAGGCAASKECTGYSDAAYVSAAACSIFRDQDGTVCTWSTGTACEKATDAAICTTVASITSDYDCNIRTTPGCYNVSGTCTAKVCTDLDGADVDTCQALKGAGGLFCTWTAAAKCSVGKDTCAGWTGATYNSVAACSPLIDKNGKKCTWKADTACTDLTCEEAVDAKSQADCDIISSGCTFYRGYCIKDAANCNTYAAHGADAAGKLTYCNGRINSTSSGKCTYINGDTCINKGACNAYNVSGLADTAAKITKCKNSVTTDANGCTYLTGDNCIEIQSACSGYSGLTAASLEASTYCLDYKTSTGLQCIGVAAANTCSSPANCEAITSPTNQASCDLYVSDCLFQNNKCMTPDTCSNYTTPGSNAISFCKGLKDNAGNYCTATADGDSTCTTRACNDADTYFFTTHAECKAYSNLCKSDGFGCINATTACTNQSGILSLKTCDALKDTDGNNCTVATALTTAAACKIKNCSDNVTATGQGECDSFMPGCKWINPGCTDKTTPCTSYRGTQAECGGFIGNSKQCWSDTPTRGACRIKKCEDKSTAADDTECSQFLDGCVFNGQGCVAKGSYCSSFKGTKDTCSSFDKNSAQPCWSISTTVGQCINKQCTHLASTKDSDCENFLPENNCITDGTTCIQGPKNCSYFKGNADTCPLFKSNQGICKKGLNGYCAKRECYEAPNTLTKDSQCNDWSPGCVTNGRGCQSSVTCSDFQNQATCGAVSGCQWASSCKAAVTTCSSLTTSGQSICVNNTAKKCAWYNGVCRELTCVDLDATLTTHDLCKAALPTLSCTTTGAGCIAQGVCSSYTTKTVCEAAETTEIEKKCTWVNAQCRVRKCEDFSGTSNEACELFLPGCKTTGTTCVASPYGCSVFSGNQEFCLTDSSGNPCYYVEGNCYNYDDCTDVSPPSKNYCKSFSPNCVAGTTTCIALNQCSKYKDQTSCYSGINSTVCGWLPSQTCDEFKQCSQATGTTLNECVAWNSSCVSDGTACVPIGDCGSYLKPLSCEGNYDTAGNACFWTGTACRLKQCSDSTGVTDLECVTKTVKEGVCTTNGTSCVLRAACSTYSTEGACTVGSDGIPCIFSFPLGTTTGTKSCRPKDCTDILGTSNDQCIGQINKKNCVSNGKTCVNQGTCASYKNKVSCAAEGSDNSRCVFTAAPTTADPLAGTCQAFTSCASASGDSVTCALNKSCKYTESTKKCETTDCKTFNPSGTTCNTIPSFDGKTYTICTSSANGCTAGDPTTLAQADCYSLVSQYTYTWNTGTSKCQSCKGSSSTTTNNSTTGNTTTNTTTDSGYILGVSMALAILGFMA